MKEKNPISSSEVGSLWLTYQEKTLILRFLEYFLEKTNDQAARNIMGGLWQEIHHVLQIIKGIFEENKMAIPVGFTEKDINLEAPPLFDNGFDIMFVRVLKEVSLGMYILNIYMSYREDVMSVYQELTSISQRAYKLCTHYLLEKGILTLPPNVSMPKTVEFVQKTSYMNGYNPFKEDRPLNDIEIGILHHIIESNNIGSQLITGFAQVAQDKAVRDYFVKGKQLAQKQIKLFEEILLNSNVQFSATSGSTVTTSTIAPFSEKMMMHTIFLLNGFSTVGQAFGELFTLRNDISLKQAMVAREIYTYHREGIKLKIKNGWFEEPPQMENRTKIINKG